MRASIQISVTIAGQSASLSQVRTDDGVVAMTPSSPNASAGVLTTRSSASAGVITTTIGAPSLTTGANAVVTWLDADDNLKHRYNVSVTVSGLAYSISGGAGDDLPDALSDINIAVQYTADLGFDFDAVDTFVVTTNVRGVIAFLDSTETEKSVIDMDTNGMALWTKDTGFPAPMSGTPITHAVYGSGSTATTSTFSPFAAALYGTSGQ